MGEVQVKIPSKILEFLEKPVNKSVKEVLAVELYREDRLTLRQTAEVIGIGLREMLKVLAKRRTYINYGEEELKEDIAYASGK